MGSSRLEIDLTRCFNATRAHCVRWHGTTDHGDEKRRALQASKVVRSLVCHSECRWMLDWPITEVNLRISA